MTALVWPPASGHVPRTRTRSPDRRRAWDSSCSRPPRCRRDSIAAFRCTPAHRTERRRPGTAAPKRSRWRRHRNRRSSRTSPPACDRHEHAERKDESPLRIRHISQVTGRAIGRLGETRVSTRGRSGPGARRGDRRARRCRRRRSTSRPRPSTYESRSNRATGTDSRPARETAPGETRKFGPKVTEEPETARRDSVAVGEQVGRVVAAVVEADGEARAVRADGQRGQELVVRGRVVVHLDGRRPGGAAIRRLSEIDVRLVALRGVHVGDVERPGHGIGRELRVRIEVHGGHAAVRSLSDEAEVAGESAGGDGHVKRGHDHRSAEVLALVAGRDDGNGRRSADLAVVGDRQAWSGPTATEGIDASSPVPSAGLTTSVTANAWSVYVESRSFTELSPPPTKSAYATYTEPCE